MSAAVLIKLSNAHGSGFLISNDGYILTNWHVVKDNKFVGIVLSTGREIAGEVIRTHKARDVALVKVGEAGFNALPLNLDEPLIGTDMFVIGAPLTKENQNTLSRGIVSKYITDRIDAVAGLKSIQSDVMIQGGNSGGPALDSNGNVICITYAGMGEMDLGINYFVPIADGLKHLNILYR